MEFGVCVLFFFFFKQILNFYPEQWNIVFSFFAYFLGLVLIEYEHVQKLFIFLNGNSRGVFEAPCCVFTEETVSLLICKVLKQILKEGVIKTKNGKWDKMQHKFVHR